jgi:hypothetical protein
MYRLFRSFIEWMWIEGKYTSIFILIDFIYSIVYLFFTHLFFHFYFLFSLHHSFNLSENFNFFFIYALNIFTFFRAANRIGLQHSREKRRILRHNAAIKVQSRVRKYLSTMHVMRLAQETYRKYVNTENEDEHYWYVHMHIFTCIYIYICIYISLDGPKKFIVNISILRRKMNIIGKFIYVYIYIYIYVYVRICIYMSWDGPKKLIVNVWILRRKTNTIGIYMYIYVYVNMHLSTMHVMRSA